MKAILSAAEFSFIKKYFNVAKDGNIFSDPQDEFTHLNIFYIDEDYRDRSLTSQQKRWLQSAKEKLNIKRRQRPRPHLDDKIITAWNGMMLSAFAEASIVFDDPVFTEEAIRTVSFIRTHLYVEKTGKLYRQYRAQKNEAGIASAEAILADYAWLVYGLLNVYEATDDKQWLNWASELQEKQDDLFLDKSSGAYFESIADDTSILFRSKSIYDGALPSANAIALSNLRKFSELAHKPADKKSLSQRANKLVNSFAAAVNENPPAAAMLLSIEVE